MIKGISINIPNEYSTALWQLLNCIDVEKMVWHYDGRFSECYTRGFEKFFKKEDYNGTEFKQLIQTEHYPIFLKLEGYNEQYENDEILTYNDFISSKCQILVLIDDNGFVWIYTKDDNMLKCLYENAIKVFSNAEYMEDNMSSYIQGFCS